MNKRDQYIHDLRKQGFTYQAIGDIVGLSLERVRQIVLDIQPISTARTNRQAEVIQRLLDIDAYALYQQGVGIYSIALRVDGPVKFVTKWLKTKATEKP